MSEKDRNIAYVCTIIAGPKILLSVIENVRILHSCELNSPTLVFLSLECMDQLRKPRSSFTMAKVEEMRC